MIKIGLAQRVDLRKSDKSKKGKEDLKHVQDLIVIQVSQKYIYKSIEKKDHIQKTKLLRKKTGKF